VTHYEVRERIESPFGKFALLDVRIETGRTHQIRVHMASIHHPVVGDALYGAPKELRLVPARSRGSGKKTPQARSAESGNSRAQERRSGVPGLKRNFLHAAAIECAHPRTGEPLSFTASLPEELAQFLRELRE